MKKNNLNEDKSLNEYQLRRNFSISSEPKGQKMSMLRGKKIFVVQEHDSKKFHYDFRLENRGVLESWAVPKGVPQATGEKRLAIKTEDHPIEYANFEGEIPEGEYGAGQVKIWDKGFFEVNIWNDEMIEVVLSGKRISGRYVIIPFKKAGKNNWILLKAKE